MEPELDDRLETHSMRNGTDTVAWSLRAGGAQLAVLPGRYRRAAAARGASPERGSLGAPTGVRVGQRTRLPARRGPALCVPPDGGRGADRAALLARVSSTASRPSFPTPASLSRRTPRCIARCVALSSTRGPRATSRSRTAGPPERCRHDDRSHRPLRAPHGLGRDDRGCGGVRRSDGPPRSASTSSRATRASPTSRSRRRPSASSRRCVLARSRRRRAAPRQGGRAPASPTATAAPASSTSVRPSGCRAASA